MAHFDTSALGRDKSKLATLIVSFVSVLLLADNGGLVGPALASGGISIFEKPTSKETLENGHVSIVLTTWLNFDRDLTISLDNLLAGMAGGDPVMSQEAQKYFDVGNLLLQKQYGLYLTDSHVVVHPDTRSIRWDTGLSDWACSEDWPHSGISGVVRKVHANSRIRWRAKLASALLSYNPAQPRKVDVYANLLLEVQIGNADGTIWTPARIAPAAMNGLQDALAAQIKTSYDQYLKNRFGIQPDDAPTFVGSSHNKATSGPWQ
jgi:hypothetical protein